MVLGQRQPELIDRGSTIGQQALAKCGISPCPGYDTRAVLRHPLLLREMVELLDRCAGVQPAVVEHGLDSINALFDRGGALETLLGVGGVYLLLRSC